MMNKRDQASTARRDSNESNTGIFLGLGVVVLIVALIFARFVFSEYMWVTGVVLGLLIVNIGALINNNQKAIRGRTAAYGLNSFIGILLVLGLLSVINFIAVKYPKKLDLTRNKVNTLSDQTNKVVKNLRSPLKATLYAKFGQKEQFKPLLDNYRSLNPKFEVDYVDPDRDPMTTKANGIKKYGTLDLSYNGKDSKVEEVTEEKVTNALIKLTKEKTSTLCALTGHGEKSFNGNEEDGYSRAKKGLNDQSYEVRDINLAQEQNKIPDTCDAIAVIGPTKGFFDPEIAGIQNYLNNGGRAVFMLDVNIKGEQYTPEIDKMLTAWNVKVDNAMIVDPVSRAFNVDASMPIVASFSTKSPITKEFRTNTPAFFPFARPIEFTPTTPGLTDDPLGLTTPQSFSTSDFKQLAKGELKLDPKFLTHGPFNVAVSVEGKATSAKAETKKTRIVVFGTSFLAINKLERNGVNLDFFLNSVSWLLEDESMISIRAKDETTGRIELSSKAGSVIFILTVILVPLAIAVAGVVIWVLRKRL